MNQPNGNPNEAAGAGEIDTGAALRACIEVTSLNVRYGALRAISDLTMSIPAHRVTALIGPSGCGKSTLLRCFNRMNDLIDNAVVEGKITLNGVDITSAGIDVAQLRRQVGIVFQKPVPFPRSVFENVAYGLRLQQKISRSELQDRVEQALRSAALWDEVEDRLQQPAHELSGGQQQRLVIARAIAIAPQVLLLDEPASALDPLSTFKIEELITHLKEHYTIVIVTHNMQQAARVSDYTALLDDGKLIEYADTNTIFMNPGNQQTEDYITGRYG